MRTLKFISISIMLLLVTIQIHAQSQKIITPKKYIAYHTKDTIKIDGLDADLAWNKIKWSDPFIDIEGVVKPTYETKIKLIWDDTYFYILAKIQEPHVWADIEEDDVIIFYNNDFEVFIDPDGDSHNYYELEINALNSIWDLFLTKPYREVDNVVLNDWNATGLKKAISIDGTLNNPNDVDSGWMLEMAIPWDVFKKSYHQNVIPKNQYWRVNFSRVNWDFEIKDDKYHRKKDAAGEYLPENNWVWSPQGVINMHEPEKWGYVYFSSKEIGSKETFSIPQDEKIKWKLYELYRAQKAYKNKHNKWATTIQDISPLPMIVDGKPIEVKLKNHYSGWNMITKSPFTNQTLIIKDDGKFISN